MLWLKTPFGGKNMSDIEKLWMVVRMDIHGTTYLMQEGLAQTAAEQCIKDILARHTNPHHQHYFTLDYTPETRKQRIQESRIML